MWLSGRATAYCLGKGAVAGPIPAMGIRLFGFCLPSLFWPWFQAKSASSAYLVSASSY